MRNLKKFLALALAMVMTFSLMLTVNAADPAEPKDFDDMDSVSTSYAEAVKVLSALKVVQGDADGFRPKDTITRAEVAAMVYRIATSVDDKQADIYKDYSYFGDVKADDWFAGYVNFCGNAQYIKGVGDNMFDPYANVTGYEVLAMILRIVGYDQNGEFTGSAWHIKTAAQARQLGILKNVKEGTLGQPATREVVAEILFQAMQVPMVNYTMLNGYQPILLVDASDANTKATQAAGGTLKTIYEKDVPNKLMYDRFEIVGKRAVANKDDYGRPVVEWMKDRSDDTVQNGGKYVVNNESALGTTAATTGAPDVTYIAADTAALAIPMTPVKVYHDAVTECQLTKDVNGDKSIYKENISEFLNGGAVVQSAGDANSGRTADLDINHTQEGTIGAPGRTTEIYKLDTKTTVGVKGDGKGNGEKYNNWVFVYYDTVLGVVTDVTKRTFDTAGNHVMQPATLSVKINDTVTVVDTSDTKDFDYSKGDLVLMTTYGMKDLNGGTTDTTTIDVTAAITAGDIQHLVPQDPTDFRADDTKTTDKDWSVDTVGKPTTATVTVRGTLGTKNHKTGIETANGNYMANVVYLASQNDKAGGGVDTGIQYKTNAKTPANIVAQTTVPSTSPYNYGYRMINAAINKSYTVVLDQNGFVVGMTAEETASDIGVILSMEPVRVGTGKWAIETELFMIDGSKKTVRLLKDVVTAEVTEPDPADQTPPADGDGPDDSNGTTWMYFASQSDADGSTGAHHNLEAAAGVLVRIESFNKDGATYHKVTETQDGKWKRFTVATDAAGAGTAWGVATGVANTLYSDTPATNASVATEYAKDPSQVAADGTTAKSQDIDNNTKFIIAEVNWDYSLNTGNKGGYSDMDYTTYTGFKTIPTVESNADTHVKFQRIGNNVFVHPNDTKLTDGTLVYTLKNKDKVRDLDAYLVYATGTTYQDYSTYKALKNGEPVELKVSNNNLTLVNSKIEAAMANPGAAVLITVSSYNTKGYATDVDATTLAGRKIPLAATVYHDKNGVIAYDSDGGATNGTGIDGFLTVADNCKVVIVNLTTGNYYPGTLDTIMQYEKYDANGNNTYDPDNDGHDFIYDLDEYGYVDAIYIMD